MRWMPARRILPRVWQIVLGILLLSIIIVQIFRRNIEPLQNAKGKLYLLLEASGFDVPELNLTQKIMAVYLFWQIGYLKLKKYVM